MGVRLFFAACLGAAVFASAGAAVRPTSSRAAAFEPQVSVWISDDAPGGHPDITTTIDIPEGAPLLRVETLTPAGGGIHQWGDFAVGTTIGWISGFSTIPGPDGQCNQRFLFNDIPLVEANPDSATFPAYLRELAPGPHRVHYTADAPGTPVNIIIDDVEIDGAKRLRATTYVGNPAEPAVGCAPFRSRIFMSGELHTTLPRPPVGTAPPSAGPRVYEFTLTSRNGDVAERKVTATVQPGLRLELEPGRLAWEAVPGVASYQVGGTVFYMTTCELVRQLVIREQAAALAQRLPADATSRPFPAPPAPDYEVAQVIAGLMAYDADGVLLARNDLQFSRDPKACWYPPGEEPLLHVSPDAGSCAGEVTFSGERFPPGVNVDVTLPAYGGDGGGPHVAGAPVAADGTFSVTATLPDSTCFYAATLPDNKITFYAYNMAEPHGLTSFAGATYSASVPPGWAASWEPNTVIPPATGEITGPVTGTGSAPTGASWQLAAMLAIAGAVVFGGGVVVRRT